MPEPFATSLRFLDEVLGIVFQPVCHLCGAFSQGHPFCIGCRDYHFLPPVREPWCDTCGETLSQPMEKCGGCLSRVRPCLEKSRSLFWLGEGARALVHKVKYSRRSELLDLLLPAFREHFRVFFPEGTTILPVPLHYRRFRDRGFNQAEILCEWIAREAGLPLEVESLRKCRPTPPQSTLTRRQRTVNLRASFQWESASKAPETALLVDDVFTTGATLEACARVLKRAGASQIYAWTLFRTPRLLTPG